jgi:hypothetical protein
LADAIERLDRLPYEPARAIAHAQTFSVEAFRGRIEEVVAEALSERRGRRG